MLRLVWPEGIATDTNVRFQIATLRKLLSSLDPARDYIVNVVGRGYRFAARVVADAGPASDGVDRVSQPASSLPPPLSRMVGRDEAVRFIARRLSKSRFVTIVGPGGVGKTTVAIAVGHALKAARYEAVFFVDLATVSDAQLVPSRLCLAFGLPVVSSDPLPGIVAYLRDESALLILDSCEHVLESVAAVAERVFNEAPKVGILATSRELLNVHGEHGYRLSPLETPSDLAALTAEDVRTYPALQLFIERAEAGSGHFELDDANAQVVAEICRRLDGIPLAIEMAAGLSASLGLSDVRDAANDRLFWLTMGRRTSIQRHRTLEALLDWSFELLTDTERKLFRRLSVIVGRFDLEAAYFIAGDREFDRAQVVSNLEQLVAKSLLGTHPAEGEARYRLLDMTRVFAANKLAGSADLSGASRRHAEFYRGAVERTNVAASRLKYGALTSLYRYHVENVRAALEWSFSHDGDVKTALALTAASARLFYGLSLYTECLAWSERAIQALDEQSRDTELELELQMAFAESRAFTRGNDEAGGRAMARGRELAERLDAQAEQMRALSNMFVVTLLAGGFHEASRLAERGAVLAKAIGGSDALAVSGWMIGMSSFYLGRQAEAHETLQLALTLAPKPTERNLIWLTVDLRLRIQCSLMWCLWLRGLADRSVRLASQAIDEAEALNHGVTLCSVYVAAEQVFLWIGDRARADDICDRLVRYADKLSLVFYKNLGMTLKLEILARAREPRAAVEALEQALKIEQLRNSATGAKFRWLRHKLPCSLAEGLAAIGRAEDAMTTIEGAIADAEPIGFLWTLPELLRVKAQLLAASGRSGWLDAETCFRASLDLAREQTALAWELQTATALARFYRDQGRAEQAAATLAQTYGQFAEGFATADLTAARELLREIDVEGS